MTYEAAEITEATQDIVYGFNGDAYTSSYNFLRAGSLYQCILRSVRYLCKRDGFAGTTILIHTVKKMCKEPFLT